MSPELLRELAMLFAVEAGEARWSDLDEAERLTSISDDLADEAERREYLERDPHAFESSWEGT